MPSAPCEASRYSSLWYIGVLLDAVATLAGTGGKQLLRYAVVKQNWVYYPLGLLCTAVIDPAFDLSAYSFAAQSIISPMGGMVVVWNVLIAPLTLGEVLTRSRKAGAALIVVGTVQTAHAIALEATLSFLGLGLPQTEPSLGLLISNGFEYMLSGKYWIAVFPGVALLITIVSINMVGDQLRDVLNPRLQR